MYAATKAAERTIHLPPARPRSSFLTSAFGSSSHSFDTEGKGGNNKDNSASSHTSKRGKKLVDAILFSPLKTKRNIKCRSPSDLSGTDTEIRITPCKEELEVPAQPPKPRSHRRHSLFGGVGTETKRTQEGKAPDSRPPQTPNCARRHRRILFGTVGGRLPEDSDSLARSRASDSPRSEKSSLHHLLRNRSETVTASLSPRTHNPYDLVNNERIKRQLQPFFRSTLLDSAAKDVAMQLARSNGAKCRPSDYYGNIGKGVDIWTIHSKMMGQKGTEKENIISSHFYHYGIGMARDREGQIYLCQLFQ
jgi:hypothetical protein